MNNDPRNIMPGDRVKVFDYSLFEDDVITPLAVTVKPATVVCRYGKKVYYPISMSGPWYYPDLVDVLFDHRPEHISHGHFTNGVEVL